MPVVTEQEQREGPKQGRKWLWLLIVPPLQPSLFFVLLLFRSVDLQAGAWFFHAYNAQNDLGCPPGWSSFDDPGPPGADLWGSAGEEVWTHGPEHARYFRISDWTRAFVSRRGRRVG
jgi:hypothetical protein